MSQPLEPDAVKEEILAVLSAISQRAASDKKVEAQYGGPPTDAETRLFTNLRAIKAKSEESRIEATNEHEKTRQATLARFEQEQQTIQSQYQAALHDVELRFQTEKETAEREKSDASWMVSSVLDDQSQDSPRFQFESFNKRIATTKERMRDRRKELDEVLAAAGEVLQRRRQGQSFPEPDAVTPPRDLDECDKRFEDGSTAIFRGRNALVAQKLSRLFAGWIPLVMFLLTWAALCVPLVLFVKPEWTQIDALRRHPDWELAVAGATAVIAIAIWGILFAVARSNAAAVYIDMQQALADVKTTTKRWVECAKQELHERKKEYERRYAEIVAQRDRALAQIEAKAVRRLDDAASRRDSERAEVEAKFPPMLDDVKHRGDREMEALDEAYQTKMAELAGVATQESGELKQAAARSRAERTANEERDRKAIASDWTGSLTRFSDSTADFRKQCDSGSQPWPELLAESWTLPEAVSTPMRIGNYVVDFERIPSGLPKDKSLAPPSPVALVPFILPFPGEGSLLFECQGEGRGVAVEGIRTTMLRLLTSIPAGKLRFTIIDPAGLGEEFSAFMHLADFDELLISQRIWTESHQIEKQLADLSEHMENVFQAYLRNEYESIEEYNKQAGEVAEPYRFLVVANFPTNFSETAARRLVSIATSGARCGVYTLISVDTRMAAPHDFELTDLEGAATTLRWHNGSFYTTDPELSLFPVRLESAPRAGDFAEIVRRVGRQSKDARRVEVPFERIVPRNGQYWTLTSRKGLEVPLGRAGATKFQSLELGKGTSQHVMVAGKTGSGKSSLLHTLITNLALHYSPDEVQFFLVDFKKGVEFKTYASHNLPHARIVGIESDREFGVSALERLNSILNERGELFRKAGVQDIGSYRQARPDERMPRLLLIIDEFQEFFVEDDATSQAANLLLDRLVRQGRAFGVHVLLGSQTLGGAYSLARSTLGQVGVRIALQCSENDSHLILAEENSAARLLTRPGEAIYNDANGLTEGNHPFQIAWLPDDIRERYLSEVQRLTESRNIQVEPTIVFEGNIPSDPRNNEFIMEVIGGYALRCKSNGDGRRGAPNLWLGEPVAIKPPTRLALEDRPGENLLLVGQDAESARGLLAVSFLTLAAQQKPLSADDSEAAQFYVFDGDVLSADDPSEWQRVFQLAPHRVVRSGQREAAEVIEQVAAEVTRRTEAGSSHNQPIFVIVSNLSRIRALRNEEDDFGFGGMDSGKPASPGKMLSNVLKDGPAVGVHCIIWCDSYGNLTRWMSSQTLREFELRLAFQMNAGDSSSLLDSPAASRLGPHRALLYQRQTGGFEKLRPYAVPERGWLAWVAEEFGKYKPLPSSSGEKPVARQATPDGNDSPPSRRVGESPPAVHEDRSVTAGGNGDGSADDGFDQKASSAGSEDLSAPSSPE